MRKLWLIFSTDQFKSNDDHSDRVRHRLDEESSLLQYHGNFYQANSLQEAEEMVSELSFQIPGHRYLVFESVALFEVVPQVPIKKRWNSNGELV